MKSPDEPIFSLEEICAIFDVDASDVMERAEAFRKAKKRAEFERAAFIAKLVEGADSLLERKL